MVPALLEMNSWQRGDFLPQEENCKSSTFLSTIYIWQKRIGSSEGIVPHHLNLIKLWYGSWLTPSETLMAAKAVCLRRLFDKDKNSTGTGVWAWGWWTVLYRVIGRCVHQRGFLADDAWGWKWPGRSPGSAKCCWVDTLVARWAPTIRWLPLRFREESETCNVFNSFPLKDHEDEVFDPPQSTTTPLELHKTVLCTDQCGRNTSGYERRETPSGDCLVYGMWMKLRHYFPIKSEKSVSSLKACHFTSNDRLLALQRCDDWLDQIAC